MKLPAFLSTKNVLLGSGIVSTIAGITTIVTSVLGVDAGCNESCAATAADDVTPPETGDVADTDAPQG